MHTFYTILNFLLINYILLLQSAAHIHVVIFVYMYVCICVYVCVCVCNDVYLSVTLIFSNYYFWIYLHLFKWDDKNYDDKDDVWTIWKCNFYSTGIFVFFFHTTYTMICSCLRIKHYIRMVYTKSDF